MRSQIISFVVIATSFQGTEGSPIHGYKFSRGVPIHGYKFSRGVIFTDKRNQGSFVINPCAPYVL